MARKRWRYHASLAGLTFAALVATLNWDSEQHWLDRLSIVSAYSCLVCLSVALLIGPRQAIRFGKPIVNHYLRRDLGIWGAVWGFGHFYLAMLLSMNNEYLERFVYADDLPFAEATQYLLYSAGTIAGFLVGVVFIVLLGLSNDWSLRRLGRRKWKRMQRLAYVAFGLIMVHGFAFQLIESRQLALVGGMAVAGAMVVFAQFAGRIAVKKAGGPAPHR